MGHYNQKTTLASLNRKMAFTKRKLRECEFDKQQLEKENAQLREEIEIHHQQLNSNSAFMEESRHLIMRQKAKINKLLETLEFYADKSNYEMEFAEIDLDLGEKARQALGLESGS